MSISPVSAASVYQPPAAAAVPATPVARKDDAEGEADRAEAKAAQAAPAKSGRLLDISA
jgi:hypothetical protein